LTPILDIKKGVSDNRSFTDPTLKAFSKTDVEKLQERTSLTENTDRSNIKDQKTDVFEIDRKDIVSDNSKEVSDSKEVKQ